MGSDLLALALRRDAASRDELAARLTTLRREQALDGRARIELEALLRELRDVVSPPMRRTIEASLSESARIRTRDDAAPRRPEAQAWESELVGFAVSCEADHLVRLARRPDLPPRVGGVVAARGHWPALRALAGNRGADIGRSLLLALSELALGDPPLRGLLIARHDLPEEAISRLWSHLSDEEKAQLLLASAPYEERDLDEILDEAELHLHFTLRDGELPVSLASFSAKERADPDKAVELLCAKRRFVDLGRFLAEHLDCELLACLNLLAMPSSRGAALLCRAAGLRRESYERIVLLRQHQGWQRQSASGIGLETFDAMSRSAARRLFALYAEASPE
jgi:hypothetical protein